MNIRSDGNGRRKDGMAMVETLIVLPVLLSVLFGMVEFSIVFSRWQALSNAAREGARTAVVFRHDCVVADVENEVRQRVKDYAAPIGIVLQDSDITVSGACGPANSNATVNVSSPYQFKVLSALAPSLSPTINTVGSSIMRNEGTS